MQLVYCDSRLVDRLKRVTIIENLFVKFFKRDIIKLKGTIPIYSANVNTPVGYHVKSNIKDLDFIDSWREQNPNEGSIYSWFDYRSRMFDDNPKRGLRIDHILVSNNLVKFIKKTGIDYKAREMEKPSDHCPVWIQFN